MRFLVMAILEVMIWLTWKEGEASPKALTHRSGVALLPGGMNCRNPIPTGAWPDHYESAIFGAVAAGRCGDPAEWPA